MDDARTTHHLAAVIVALAAPIAAPFAAILAGPVALAPTFVGCLIAAFVIERPR